VWKRVCACSACVLRCVCAHACARVKSTMHVLGNLTVVKRPGSGALVRATSCGRVVRLRERDGVRHCTRQSSLLQVWQMRNGGRAREGRRDGGREEGRYARPRRREVERRATQLQKPGSRSPCWHARAGCSQLAPTTETAAHRKRAGSGGTLCGGGRGRAVPRDCRVLASRRRQAWESLRESAQPRARH
jgi:hypothetical protein